MTRVSLLSVTALALANAKTVVEQAPQWPYLDYTPTDFTSFKAGVQDAVVQVMKMNKNGIHFPGRRLSEDFDISAVCNSGLTAEQIGDLIVTGIATSAPPGTTLPTVDKAAVGRCICSDATNFNTLFSDTSSSSSNGIPREFLALCTGDCRALLDLIVGLLGTSLAQGLLPSPAPGTSSGSSIPDISTAIEPLINCGCAKPTLLDALSNTPTGGQVCELCGNNDCKRAASLLAGDEDPCTQLPRGFCSTSSAPESFTMAMQATGSVSDFTPAVKDAMKSNLVSLYNSNLGSSTGTITASNVDITVTEAAGRRLAETAGAATRRLQSSGTVDIAMKITLPLGVSAEYIGTSIASDANTRTQVQSAMNTAITSSGGSASVTGVDSSIAVETSGSSDSDPCFPSSSLVTLVDGTPRRLDALKDGDTIVAAAANGTLTTDTISLLSIAKPHVKSAFFTLVTSGGKTLNVTAEHHLPVGAACCSNLKTAKDIQLGEVVHAVVDGAVVAQTVTKKFTSSNQGLHSPVLARGTYPVVDGVVTAFDGPYSVAAASYALAPILSACKATGTCEVLKRVHAMINKRDAKTEYI